MVFRHEGVSLVKLFIYIFFVFIFRNIVVLHPIKKEYKKKKKKRLHIKFRKSKKEKMPSPKYMIISLI